MLISSIDEMRGPTIKAVGLNKWVRKDLNLLQDISLVIQPNEFVVVVGQSGGGKSTLVDALAGYRPATHGHVYVNDADVYQDFDSIRTIVGYVPQRDIIHMELTVYQALDYAARLRMPPSTTSTERRLRIMEVLQDLDLTHRKDAPVGSLSGGQQKRVSIGVELLTRPKLFFLDEPTSGLDPGTEASLMNLMRRLASQGRTIVLITHSTKNVMLADKVIFLARGGYLAWFGPPRAALEYFDPFRPPVLRDARSMEFDDIYAILEDSRQGTPKDWGERYRQSDACKEYIERYLENEIKAVPQEGPRFLQMIRSRFDSRRIGPLREFAILSARNLRILTRDKASLILMLLVPPLVSCLDLLIAPVMGRNLYDPRLGIPVGAVMTLFLLTLYSLMVSGLSQMREIVKEQEIYKRERLVFLHILPYVFSKIWLACLLAVYQAIAYTGVHYLAFNMPGGSEEFLFVFITLFLGTLTGMFLGLFASALSPNMGSAPMITILFIIPCVVLSGALVQLPQAVSAPSTSYWSFKALVAITGAGSDAIGDACWQLPAELLQVMTQDDRAALGCNCMGVSLFDPAKCNFPGNLKYYVAQVDQPQPTPPSAPGDPPAEPAFPDPPAEPADPYDKVQVAMYLNDLQAYQAQVNQAREEYKQDFDLYQNRIEIYQAQMKAYQGESAQWYVARAGAIGSAEGNIKGFLDRFGWAFVDKSDRGRYLDLLQTCWMAQGGLMLALWVGICIAMKSKDHR